MRIHVISALPLSEAQKARLRKCGELHYFDGIIGDDGILDQARGAEILVMMPRVHLDITTVLDGCRFISWQGTGVDALNLQACREKGIVVSNVPDFSTDSVAEHAWALLLALAKRIEEGRPLIKQGRWTATLAYPTVGLRGKTLGLFGLGKIGERIAHIGAGFGMNVIAAVRDSTKQRPVKTVGFEVLLAQSDFLVLAAPATPETQGLFNRSAFEKMRRTAYLVNIARGSLIDEAELAEALDEGLIAGAGLDVFGQEPPDAANPLPGHSKVVVSPHVAWGTDSSTQALMNGSIDNVEAFVQGRPIHVVS